MRLSLLGDNNVQERATPEQAYSRLREAIDASDVLIGHLEGLFYPPSTNPDSPDIPFKPRWRHSDPSQVAGYVAASFDILCCAGNVSYGKDAVINTLGVLDENGLAHAGLGLNVKDAHRPAIVDRGMTVGLLSYGSVYWPSDHAATDSSPGIATIAAHTAYQPGPRTLEMPGAPPRVITWPDPEELSRMEQAVRQLRTAVDVLVVSCHWGVSSARSPVDYQRAIAHAAIDSGADIVFGHHPHVIQPIEVFRGKPIFYSLGNAAFDWFRMRSKHFDGLMVNCDVRESKITSVRVLPIMRDSENYIAPAPCSGPEGRRIAETLIAASKADCATELRIDGQEIVVL